MWPIGITHKISQSNVKCEHIFRIWPKVGSYSYPTAIWEHLKCSSLWFGTEPCTLSLEDRVRCCVVWWHASQTVPVIVRKKPSTRAHTQLLYWHTLHKWHARFSTHLGWNEHNYVMGIYKSKPVCIAAALWCVCEGKRKTRWNNSS